MEKYETEVNGSSLSIYIKTISKPDKPNFKAIANVNFGWFEVPGFRVTYFDGNTKKGYQKPRREDGMEVQPPSYPQGPYKWNEAFRTVAPIKDPDERDRVRKQYWYSLQDEIIEAYYKFSELEKKEEGQGEQRDYYPNLAEDIEKLMDEEIDIDKIPFK